jgi:DNA-binding IclR family transcriptional regulator
MSAPAFDADGKVSLLISLNGFDTPLSAKEVEAYSSRLTRAAARITELVGGRLPVQAA